MGCGQGLSVCCHWVPPSQSAAQQTCQCANMLLLLYLPLLFECRVETLGAHVHKVKLSTKNWVAYETQRLVRGNSKETKIIYGLFSSFG